MNVPQRSPSRPEAVPDFDKTCTIRCNECGGTNIQLAVWYRPNTEEVLHDYGSFDYSDTKWCEDCKEHTTLNETEEKK